jgi:hypothetical protein
MKPRVLFIVTGDPRSSTRPAEAVRIAAGVSAWQKADITVYLRDTAVLALGESSGVLMEEENYARSWAKRRCRLRKFQTINLPNWRPNKLTLCAFKHGIIAAYNHAARGCACEGNPYTAGQ